MKCIHDDITVEVPIIGRVEYRILKGDVLKTISDISEMSIQRRYKVQCHKCGLKRVYNQHNLPKWVAVHLRKESYKDSICHCGDPDPECMAGFGPDAMYQCMNCGGEILRSDID